MTGIELIAAERKRQIIEDGWTAEQEDKQSCEELVQTAIYLAWPKYLSIRCPEVLKNLLFDWDSKSRKEHLAIAGALLAAEIDRLDRLDEAMEKIDREGRLITFLSDLSNLT